MKKVFLYKLTIGLLLLLNAILLFVLLSKPNEHRPPRPLSEVLNFSGSTKSKIDSLERLHFIQKDAYMWKGRKMRARLFEYVLKKEENIQERDSILVRITKNQEQIERNTADYFKRIYALCNKEQKEQLRHEIRRVLMRHGPPPHAPRHD